MSVLLASGSLASDPGGRPKEYLLKSPIRTRTTKVKVPAVQFEKHPWSLGKIVEKFIRKKNNRWEKSSIKFNNLVEKGKFINKKNN